MPDAKWEFELPACDVLEDWVDWKRWRGSLEARAAWAVRGAARAMDLEPNMIEVVKRSFVWSFQVLRVTLVGARAERVVKEVVG